MVVSVRLKGGPRAETRVILVSRAFALMNDDHESESYGVEIEPSVHRNLVLFVEALEQQCHKYVNRLIHCMANLSKIFRYKYL